jgi:hypothetical protein
MFRDRIFYLFINLVPNMSTLVFTFCMGYESVTPIILYVINSRGQYVIYTCIKELLLEIYIMAYCSSDQ